MVARRGVWGWHGRRIQTDYKEQHWLGTAGAPLTLPSLVPAFMYKFLFLEEETFNVI